MLIQLYYQIPHCRWGIYRKQESLKMDILKKFFPTAFKSNDLKPFIISLIVYLLIDIVCGVVIGVLAKLPLIGIIFSLIGTIIGLYALIGIILSVLVFVKVIK